MNLMEDRMEVYWHFKRYSINEILKYSESKLELLLLLEELTFIFTFELGLLF